LESIQTDVLVVGGGTGGVAAAIQAARRGAKTVLVSESSWLGGMLTSAGVTAPDGLELLAFQTGIWGAFLQELRRREPAGLDHAWVSFFTYLPQTGAAIFADWVQALPNLRWIQNELPLEVERRQDSVTAVRFANYRVESKVILDATELGDLLALAEVPHRWGWEWYSQWQEPSAPRHPSGLTQTYSVQAPTWVFVLQAAESALPTEPQSATSQFAESWTGFGAEAFLNYGRLPDNRFMINWPEQGNDYGLQADRLIQSAAARQEFWQDAYAHAQDYADWLLDQLGGGYELATGTFPKALIGGGAYALQPYYRESRRLQGLATVCEQDILPVAGGQVAALPMDAQQAVNAVAIGNYANDHHYPGFRLALQPKSIRWGGRWTGTPFALPYGSLVPATTDGLLVCEKNISVSHIANGATRLQPTVLNIGQAAGMAAALCVEQGCQPRDLPVRALQTALLQDPTAPAAVVPLFNLLPQDPDWRHWQQYYLDHPAAYPMDGHMPQFDQLINKPINKPIDKPDSKYYEGYFERDGEQSYRLSQIAPGATAAAESVQLVSLHPAVNQQLQDCQSGQFLRLQGRLNRSGNWLLVEQLESNLLS
jgi:hypothetical protein